MHFTAVNAELELVTPTDLDALWMLKMKGSRLSMRTMKRVMCRAYLRE